MYQRLVECATGSVLAERTPTAVLPLENFCLAPLSPSYPWHKTAPPAWFGIRLTTAACPDHSCCHSLPMPVCVPRCVPRAVVPRAAVCDRRKPRRSCVPMTHSGLTPWFSLFLQILLSFKVRLRDPKSWLQAGASYYFMFGLIWSQSPVWLHFRFPVSCREL